MHDVLIDCPECGAKFSVDASLKKQVQEEAEKELKKMRTQILEREKEFQDREKLLEEQEVKFQDKLQEALLKQTRLVEKKADEAAAKKVEMKFKDLEEQLSEKSTSLSQSQKEQLDLRKKVREVQEKEKSLDLEISKRVQEACKKTEEEATKLSSDKFKYELLQKEKVIQQMRDQTDELQRKLLQGSQQTQGEVVEEDFEKNLRLRYPSDKFDEVPKGIDGADLIQHVRDQSHKICGSILLEFKNQKTFSPSWIPKLSEDLRKTGSNIAVLITRVMPKNTSDIEIIDGVYVVSYDVAIPFIGTLRKSLEELSRAQLVSVNQDVKMAMIYEYLTGDSFKQKFRSIITAYRDQKDLLEQEKRSLTRIWAKREKQLGTVIDAAASMYGDVEGIIGSAAPVIEELALIEVEEEYADGADLL